MAIQDDQITKMEIKMRSMILLDYLQTLSDIEKSLKSGSLTPALAASKLRLEKLKYQKKIGAANE